MAQQNVILENLSDKEVLVRQDQVTRSPRHNPVDQYIERAKIDGSTAEYMVTGFNPITEYDPNGVTDDEYRKLASAPVETEKFELKHYKQHDVFGPEILNLALGSKEQNQLIIDKLANMAINFTRERFKNLQKLMSIVDVSKKDCPYRKEQILEWKKDEFKKAEQEDIALKIDELIGNCTDGINNTKSKNDAYCEEKDVLMFVSRQAGTKINLALNNKLIADKLSIASRLLDIIPATKLTNDVAVVVCSKYTIKSDFCIDTIVKDPMRGDTLKQVVWRHLKEHTNLSAKNPLVCLKLT